MPVTFLASLLSANRRKGLRAAFSALIRRMKNHYRPELHYMRGPGPRWHARNSKPASGARAGGTHRLHAERASRSEAKKSPLARPGR